MSGVLETLITVVIGSITTVSKTITSGISTLEDFFYVRINGLSFIVLGARQVGKTTLIEWLNNNMNDIQGFEPEPTAAGGDDVGDFTSKIGDTHMKLKPNRDVGGEYSMWETDWMELFREANPRGIIFMMDHTDTHLQKDALNFVMQMFDDEPSVAKNLKAVFIIVNKFDLWGEETTLDEIMDGFRNERRRLSKQAEKYGFKYAITYGSLETGLGVRAMMKKFFNLIRPKTRKQQDVA